MSVCPETSPPRRTRRGGSSGGRSETRDERHCDRAVDRTPSDDDDYESAHRARGVVRALTGSFEGAATDLEASDLSADETTTGGRWIAALHQGRNPFSPAVLEGMRR